MLKDCSGFAAMPFNDIAPEPVMKAGMDVPTSPSMATFPIASDSVTFNNDISLDLRLLGAFRAALLRDITQGFH